MDSAAGLQEVHECVVLALAGTRLFQGVRSTVCVGVVAAILSGAFPVRLSLLGQVVRGFRNCDTQTTRGRPVTLSFIEVTVGRPPS